MSASAAKIVLTNFVCCRWNSSSFWALRQKTVRPPPGGGGGGQFISTKKLKELNTLNVATLCVPTTAATVGLLVALAKVSAFSPSKYETTQKGKRNRRRRQPSQQLCRPFSKPPLHGIHFHWDSIRREMKGLFWRFETSSYVI